MIERASCTDPVFLAMETREVPQQIAVVLILDPPADLGLSRLMQIVADRILAVPRFAPAVDQRAAGRLASGLGGRCRVRHRSPRRGYAVPSPWGPASAARDRPLCCHDSVAEGSPAVVNQSDH